MLAAARVVWSNPYVKTAVLVAMSVVALLVLRETRLVWGSFLLAVLSAYLLAPVVELAERRGLPRWVGIVAVVSGVVAASSGVGLLGVVLASQLADLRSEIPGLVGTLTELPFRAGRLIDPTFGDVFQQVFAVTGLLSERLVSDVIPPIEDLGVAGVRRLAGAVGDAGTSLVLILVVSLYLLHRLPGYLHHAYEAVPERHRPFVSDMAHKLDRSVGGFVRGQVAIAVVVGVLSGTGLWVIGVPLALFLGLLAGVFNVVPFFGPLLVLLPTLTLAATLGIGHVFAAAAWLLAVNVLDGNVLTPLIYERTIELDPITIIVSIFLGATLFGLLGALLAVPAAAFVKVVYVENVRTSRWFRGSDDAPRSG